MCTLLQCQHRQSGQWYDHGLSIPTNHGEETIPERSRVYLRWKVGMRVRQRSSRKRHFTKLCPSIRDDQPVRTPKYFLWRTHVAFTLFQKDQVISYVDVTSLYPYINKTGKTPIDTLRSSPRVLQIYNSTKDSSNAKSFHQEDCTYPYYQ